MNTAIYLDYNASTPIHPAVQAAMAPFLAGSYGNPSSGHWAGAPAALADKGTVGQGECSHVASDAPASPTSRCAAISCRVRDGLGLQATCWRP